MMRAGWVTAGGPQAHHYDEDSRTSRCGLQGRTDETPAARAVIPSCPACVTLLAGDLTRSGPTMLHVELIAHDVSEVLVRRLNAALAECPGDRLVVMHVVYADGSRSMATNRDLPVAADSRVLDALRREVPVARARWSWGRPVRGGAHA